MDYEKKYKDALDWIRRMYPILNNSAKEDAEHYFPELKENEDERIRKEIIDWMKGGNTYHWQENKEKWITYLEKQKEQKPVQDNEEKEYVRTLKSLIADFLRGKDEVDREYYQKIYDWLDGRHIEQKSAEWSEEDEKIKNNTILSLQFLIGESVNTEFIKGVEKEITWLKSLRPQPHWKPSEEQMEALMLAIEGKWEAIMPTGYMSRRLEDLYEGLANTFKVECKLEK